MISVIIPAYNAQEYIGEALDSILAQFYTDIEVIVVNDGSTDDTATVLSQYAALDHRIHILTTHNRGVSAARNLGLDNATGQYIAFLDADDAFINNTLGYLHSLIEETSADIAIGAFSHKRTTVGRDSVALLTGHEAAIEALYQKKILNSIWNSLISRDLIGNLRFKTDKRYEDLDFLVRLLVKADKVALSERVIYWYRINHQSFINNYTASRFDVLDITDRLETDLKSISAEIGRATRDRRLSANFNMYGLIAANNDRSRAETADSCWQIIKRYRKESLFNPKVRLKNKVGILLSYLGRPLFTAIAKRFYS